MNTIEIKGTVPGAGKTTSLVKTVVELLQNTSKTNLVILTPSNKNKQNIQQMLLSYGVSKQSLVKTFREFKQNFTKWKVGSRIYDQEAMEYVAQYSSEQYITTESKFHYKKVWDYVFIDEAGMISKAEMDDLIKHFKIRHLILVGDSNQFAPIPNCQVLEGTKESIWIDNGDFYDVPINYQFLLNSSMRAKDRKLNKVINLIKEGDIISFLAACQKANTEIKKDDWNIAYTNAACNRINSLYREKCKVSKYIVCRNDKKHGFSKSEILEVNSNRFEKLRNSLVTENIDWEDWRNIYLRPAMCITSHKLQGTTIKQGNVRIHLDDVIAGVYNNDSIKFEDKVTTIQKYLYIAVSRACRFDQIQVLWHGKELRDLLEKLMRTPAGLNERIDDINETFSVLMDEMKPLADDNLQNKPYWEGSAKDKDLVTELCKVLTMPAEANVLEGEEEFRRNYSMSRSCYTEDDLLYAITHTYSQARDNKNWTKDLYYKLRRRFKKVDRSNPTYIQTLTYQLNNKEIHSTINAKLKELQTTHKLLKSIQKMLKRLRI